MIAFTIIIVCLFLIFFFIYRQQHSIHKMSDRREESLREEGVRRWGKEEVIGKNGNQYSVILPNDWNPVTAEKNKEFGDSCDFVVQSFNLKSQIGCIATNKNDFSDLFIFQDQFRKEHDFNKEPIFYKEIIKDTPILKTDFVAQQDGRNFHYLYYVFETNAQMIELLGRTLASQYHRDENILKVIMESIIETSNAVEKGNWKVMTFDRKNLRCSIEVPNHWMKTNALVSDDFVFVIDNGRETEIVGCACEAKSDFKDLNSYKYFAKKVVERDEQKEIEFFYIQKGSERFWVADYESSLWGGQHHMFQYLIEGEELYIQLYSWTLIERTPDVDERILRILNSFREVKS